MSEEINPATSQRPVTEGEAIVNASRSYFVAQRDAAAAELMVYLNRTSGVADHPNVVGNVNELVKRLAEANECLRVIQQTFSSSPETASR
jgi:hypothetical protein